MFSKDFQILNSEDYSQSFLKFVTDLVNSENWISSKDLYVKIFKKGKNIIKKFGKRTPLLFVILKVLKIIREECARVLSGNPELEEQATNLLFADIEDKDVPRLDLQEFLSEAILELTMEVKDAENVLKETAFNYILDDDIIMVYGYSDLVFGVLKYAKENKQRNFSVFVLEGRPLKGALKMVDELSKLCIQVTLAPESASYMLLSRCHKVLVEAETSFTDGGLLCRAGVHRICFDAKSCGVPVYVCMPSFRLCPFISLTHHDIALDGFCGSENCSIYCSDVVPASLVEALITNLGLLKSSQLMSMARDSFCSEDVKDFLSAINK